ncbi:MAG: hypothetical protein WCS30_11980 [Selenomonadaceae bacterium]
MTKKELMHDMKGDKGLLCQKDVAAYLGRSAWRTAELLIDVPYISSGRIKLYYAGDIADKLLSLRH